MALPVHLHVELLDGTRLLVRPIGPGDRERLATGMAGLSSRSRYQRFQHEVRELGDDMLDRFTDVDQDDHFAWGALDVDRPEHPGAGVARSIRLADAYEAAEIAITVSDDHQGRGVGSVLLAVLVVGAQAVGVTRFVAFVLQDNATMVGMLRQLGARMEEEDFDVLRAELELPADPGEVPDTRAGGVLRQLMTHVGSTPGDVLRIADHGDAAEVPRRTSRHERGPLQGWLDDAFDEGG